VQEAAVVVRRGEHVLLRRCRSGERWAGLWDFPRFTISATGNAPLQQQLVTHVARTTGLKVTIIRQLATIKHAVTRYRITLTCHEARCRARRLAHEHLIWVTVDQLDEYPLSTTGRKLCRLLQE
jgi:A/G-specific adenine glycosylase